MGKKRVRHNAEFKAKVALEALAGLKTVNELAGQYPAPPHTNQPMEAAGARGRQNSICQRAWNGHPRGCYL